MSQEDQEKSNISRAYNLLLEEIRQTLIFSKKAFLDVKDILNNKEELIRKFHMMKGGSGFFGLHDIAKIAGEIESELKKVSGVEDLPKRLVKEFLKKLKAIEELLAEQFKIS